jgi:hypothetical protein
MGSWTGATTLTEIFQTTNNWKRYVAWKEGRVRPAVVAHVNRMLTCRTVQRGMHLYRCDSCDLVKVVPHSCKSVCCSSCGKARTDQWCKELLSDLLDVPYRHLVFTIPWELRLLIQDNRQVLLDVLFRAAARAVLSLTAGQVWPRGRKSQAWLAAKKKHSPYVPGMIIVLHTFGSDLKWNPHLHVILTAGGLSRNGARWVSAPRRYLVPAPLLATEWKLNVITGVREAHESQPLFRRRLRSDRRRRIDVDKLLGHIRKKRWHILVGPTLRQADKVVRYACRYTKRPAIAEGRIVRFKNGYVTFRFKDYHRGGAHGYKTLPVLTFIDRLVQHLPERNFRQVRYYGMFSTAKRTEHLATARSILAQRKKRRMAPITWAQRRKAAGDRRPLSCPQCGRAMVFWCLLFGNHAALARIIGVQPEDRIPPGTVVSGAVVRSASTAA